MIEDGMFVGMCGGRTCTDLVGMTHHFEKFAAAQLKVDLGICFEDVCVVCFCVFEGFVDVPVQDCRADF